MTLFSDEDLVAAEGNECDCRRLLTNIRLHIAERVEWLATGYAVDSTACIEIIESTFAVRPHKGSFTIVHCLKNVTKRTERVVPFVRNALESGRSPALAVKRYVRTYCGLRFREFVRRSLSRGDKPLLPDEAIDGEGPGHLLDLKDLIEHLLAHLTDTEWLIAQTVVLGDGTQDDKAFRLGLSRDVLQKRWYATREKLRSVLRQQHLYS